MLDDDLVFKALADPVRRVLLDALFAADGRTAVQLEAVVNEHVEMTRFGVAKHLRVLEQADLVVSRRRGREKVHHLNPVPIQQIHHRWIGKYAERAGISAVLLELKQQVEHETDQHETDQHDTNQHDTNQHETDQHETNQHETNQEDPS